MSLDLHHARVTFRDRSVADVLDLALRFIVVHGRSYAKVALVVLGCGIGVSLLAGWTFGWAGAWFVALPLAIAAEIPFTVLASRLVFEDKEKVRARDVLRAALRDSIGVLFVRALAFIAIGLGFFVLFIPAVWLGTIWLFLSEVMLLERSGMGQAFGRSQRIASSAVSDVLLGILILALVPVASVFLMDVAGRSVIGELLQFRPPQPFWSTNGGVLATLGLFAQVPYLATARFFLYLNVRTRAEGWDIQTRFAAIAARAAEEAAAQREISVGNAADTDGDEDEDAAA